MSLRSRPKPLRSDSAGGLQLADPTRRLQDHKIMDSSPTHRRSMLAGLLMLLAAPALADDNLREVNEVYRSRAEAFNAEAQNKQANAAIINAMANYGKAAAEARKINQETREKSALNDLLETKVYYDKRGLYHTYQDAHRPKRGTPEQYAEWARKAGPTRLAADQLWIKPGYLRWPSVLRHADFADCRGQIDNLLSQRTPTDSGAGSENCVQIRAQVDSLKKALAAKVKQFKTNDYLAARRFLENVALEAETFAEPPRAYASVIGN
jgi:hypothetical protein